MREPYLVLFVLEPVDDDHAEVFARIADSSAQLHVWDGPEPRAFDARPSETEERTVGVAIRIPARPSDRDAAAIGALVGAAGLAADRLGVGLEVQLAEERLGEIRSTVPDPQVLRVLWERLGVQLS